MISLSHALTDLVQHWTMLEIPSGAIARIKSFSEDTPSEESADEESQLSADWPMHGALKFENVTASYTYVAMRRYLLAFILKLINTFKVQAYRLSSKM